MPGFDGQQGKVLRLSAVTKTRLIPLCEHNGSVLVLWIDLNQQTWSLKVELTSTYSKFTFDICEADRAAIEKIKGIKLLLDPQSWTFEERPRSAFVHDSGITKAY